VCDGREHRAWARPRPRSTNGFRFVEVDRLERDYRRLRTGRGDTELRFSQISVRDIDAAPRI